MLSGKGIHFIFWGFELLNVGVPSDAMAPPQRSTKRQLARGMGQEPPAHSSRLVRTPILPLVLTLPIYISENPCHDGKKARKRLPVVILLGWGGCRDKNLAKYSAIYHKRVSTVGKCSPRMWASATLLLCGEH